MGKCIILTALVILGFSASSSHASAAGLEVAGVASPLPPAAIASSSSSFSSPQIGAKKERRIKKRSSQHEDVRMCGGAMCRGAKKEEEAQLLSSDDLNGKYPWWTGVELGKAGAPIKIEAFLSYTCPDCREHYENVWIPLIDKYGDRVSFIQQPFALPYQPFSYDATQAAFAVYRLSGNNPKVFREWSQKMFKEQLMVYRAYDMTVRQVWTTFASWGEAFGLKTSDIVNAMNGTITTANYDAWYSARFARQRTLPGAPSFIINDWLPFDLNLADWTVEDWSQWIDANLPK